MNRTVDAVFGWVEFQTFRIRHGVAWRVRKFRGLTGDFREPENSGRAAHLTRTWEAQWPGQEPLSYLIKTKRSVRFHSLPASKRYADSEREYQEILRRQQAILRDLMRGAELTSLVIVAADWSARALESGSSRRTLAGAWPWRIGSDRFDLEAPPIYFWAQLGIDSSGLETLLRAGADDQGRYLFTDPAMTWLFCPYDGGVDVFLPTTNAVDEMKRKYADWLPTDRRQ